MREELVEIVGSDGLTRRGIITIPVKNPKCSTGIVFIPAGLKYHVGPHRFYVKLARQLAYQGYSSLRFDPLSLGESDGILPIRPTKELWNQVEQGLFVNDTILATRFLKLYAELKSVVTMGICGGAVTGMLTHPQSSGSVAGNISINLAVSLSKFDPRHKGSIGTVQVSNDFNSYMKNLFSASAWKRVLRIESDFNAIKSTVLAKAKHLFIKPKSILDASSSARTNRVLVEAVTQCCRSGTPHLMIFSGNDSRWFEFQDLVLAQGVLNIDLEPSIQIATIPDANHELHFSMWQRQALELILDWLNSLFSKQDTHNLTIGLET